jgi:hypothetical protein
MRFSLALVLLATLTVTLSRAGDPRPSSVAARSRLTNETAARETPASQRASGSVSIYDPDPRHIWNRVHAAFFVRDDLPGTELVPDALDPPFWYHTTYLLTEPSHGQALRVLDEFLQTHAENLIHDPLKRVLLQRDLWAVFDWSANRASGYEKQRQELQEKLAEILHRLALTPDQIAALPDNYAQAVASADFAKEYDPQHRERAFLPSDLFDPQGSWVELTGPGKPLPVAEQHDSFFGGRSSFHILLRLPAGRKATFDYLKTLWNAPGSGAQHSSPKFSPIEDEAPNPDLPQLPAGSEVALIRQLNLFDNRGKMTLSPIIESVQIRVYRSIAPSTSPAVGVDQMVEKSGQDSYAIRLSRQFLFAGQSGGLKAALPDERDFTLFGGGGPDEGSPGHYATLASYHPVVKACVLCHQEVGVQALRSRARLMKPNPLQTDGTTAATGPRWPQDSRVLSWKQSQESWRLLNAYLKPAQ